MRIRIIVRECDLGAAMHVGGPVNTRHRSFDVELPELEQHLRAEGQPDYLRREVIGVEVLPQREADPSREYRELMLLAASDLESWMKSYHPGEAATAETVKRLRAAAGVDLPDGVVLRLTGRVAGDVNLQGCPKFVAPRGPSLSDAQCEALIKASDGYWEEDVFCIGAPELMALLRAAAHGVEVRRG